MKKDLDTPDTLHPAPAKMSRRGFLKTSALLGAAGLAASVPGSSLMAAEKKTARQATKQAAKPDTTVKLKFRADGKFKILQLTDTHYIAGRPASERALRNVVEMLDQERPDLVIHTGDMIFGKPADLSIREILAPISERKIPFLVALGNHDGQFGLSRRQVFDLVRELPYNKNQGVEGVYGCSNDLVTLAGATDGVVKRALFLFDSGDRLPYDTNSKQYRGKGLRERGCYDYIHFDQIAWYRHESERLQAANAGKTVPALAFFHIPVPEYNYATRLTLRRVMKGNYGEEPYSPQLNSGLWTQMRERGDVEAIFCGHDHDNDYAMEYNDTFLCFGRFSGCDNVYNDLKPSGARVIELTEGQPGFRSWIRLYGGEIQQNCKFPEDFKTNL